MRILRAETLSYRLKAGAKHINLKTLAQAPQPLDTQEAVAILFAQHFADTLRQPSAEAQQRLADTFSDRQQQEILAFIHAIYFANLSGNSFDALIARLKGDKIANGHLVAATIASMLSAASSSSLIKPLAAMVYDLLAWY